MSAVEQDSVFDAAAEPPKSEMSMLALGAFVLSILGCTSPIGALLGVVALVRLVGQPAVRGRGLALAAVVLGTCFSIGIGAGGYVLVSRLANLTAFVEHAPATALEAGFAGDLDGFREVFATEHPEIVAQSFIDELRDRYGELESVVLTREPTTTAASERDGRSIFPALYRARFASGTVDLEIEIMPGDESKGVPHLLESIRVVDRQRLPLRYPPLPEPPTGDPLRRPAEGESAPPLAGADTP